MPIFLKSKVNATGGSRESEEKLLKSPDSLLTDLFEGFQDAKKTAGRSNGGVTFRPKPLNLLLNRNSKETLATDGSKYREAQGGPSVEVSTSPTSFGLSKKYIKRQSNGVLVRPDTTRVASRFVQEITRQVFDFKPLLLRREQSMFQVSDKLNDK